MAHPNHSLRGHLVQMGNFCIADFLLQGQTELPGWVGVQEAPQNPGKSNLGHTGFLTAGHRQEVTPKHHTKDQWALRTFRSTGLSDMADRCMQHLIWRVLVERPFGEQHKKGLLAGGNGKPGNKDG